MTFLLTTRCMSKISRVMYPESCTLTLTLKIVYLDTTDFLQLNYYVQHIGNKKII